MQLISIFQEENELRSCVRRVGITHQGSKELHMRKRGTDLFLDVKRVWHFYWETGVLGEAVREAWTHTDPHLVTAKVIVVGLVFAGYHLYQGIDRRLGQGKLWRMIFSRG